MARFSVDVPSLVGGVSQQAPQLRLVGQAEAQTNFYPSLVDGLQRRHPIDHVATLDDLSEDVVYPPRDYHVHLINRDEGEQYIVLVADEGTDSIQVFDAITGERLLVRDTFGTSDPSYTYIEQLNGAPANTNIKCLTIADYTLVLNRQADVELLEETTGPDPSDHEGFLFVRTGNYNTTYRAKLLRGGTEYTVSVTTWDGTNLTSGVREEWELTILTTGGTGSVWTVVILGQTATYTVVGGDTPTTVAAGIAAAVNALNFVSATSSGPVVTIVGDAPGQHFVPAVYNSGGGVFTLDPTVLGTNQSNLASVATEDIAQALMDQILALPGLPFSAERLGAVVHVESNGGVPFSRMRVEEGHDVIDMVAVHRSVASIDMLPLIGVHGYTIKIDGDTADTGDDYYATFQLNEVPVQDEWDLTITQVGDVGKVWSVTVLGNEATYTVLPGDTVDDVALQLQLQITAFPNVSATVLGATVTILADTPGYSVRPTVVPPLNGRYERVQVASSTDLFGSGKWTEGRGYDLSIGLAGGFMPHQLVRRVDDSAGTVTGTPNGRWFEFSAVDWVERAVGDAESAPDPSIVGKKIQDMYFFRNRLGFCTGQQVVMSEVNRFFNLYRTTVLSLPDSDPIDITVPSLSVVDIHRAIPVERKLILFASGQTEFVLDGDPLLTPKTVQVSECGRWQSDTAADPIADKDGVYFASSRGNFSGVRRLYPSGQVDGQYGSDDATIAVPQYLPGPIIQFAVIEPEGLLVALCEDDRQALYLFKTYRTGDQNLQSAWFRYNLGIGEDDGLDVQIQGFGTIGSTLYLVVWRSIGAYLEKTVIQSDRVDPGADYLTHLDRRVAQNSGTYSIITGRTTWTLPYRVDSDATNLMVTRSTTGVDGGDVHPLQVDATTFTTTDVSTQGDHSTEPVWLGQEFESRYRFSKLYLKSDSAAGGQALRVGGRLQSLHGSLVYEKTASLAVEVTPRLRPTRVNSSPFSGLTISEALLGSLSLPAGDFRFPIFSEDAIVEIVADGALPCAIQAAAFEVNWSPRMAQYRGGA